MSDFETRHLTSCTGMLDSNYDRNIPVDGDKMLVAGF